MPPKNPVRAARQEGRQAVRSARTANREDKRTARTTAKVDKIVKRTATKVNKINDKVVTRANKEPMIKMEPKGMTKIEPKGGSTGLVPAPQLTGPKPSTPRSVTPAKTSVKKTAPVKKSTPKSTTPKAKTPAPKTGPKLTAAGEAAVAKANRDRKMAAIRETVNSLKTIQDKAFAEAMAKSYKAFEPKSPGYGQRKRGGAVKKYSHGGGMKGKKC